MNRQHFPFLKVYLLQDSIFCFLNPFLSSTIVCVAVCWEMLEASELFCFVIESVGGGAWIPFLSPRGSGCPPFWNQIFMLIH